MFYVILLYVFCLLFVLFVFFFFFFIVPAPTEIYPLSLPDALPISCNRRRDGSRSHDRCRIASGARPFKDRKSTRLNSSHVSISYAVFCLKKKKKKKKK